jgi:hypothetical protein
LDVLLINRTVTIRKRSGFRDSKLKEGLFPPEGIFVVPEKSTYEIVVLETLKGKKRKKLKVHWESCRNGFPELKEKVIVYRNKGWDYVQTFEKHNYDEITANK